MILAEHETQEQEGQASEPAKLTEEALIEMLEHGMFAGIDSRMILGIQSISGGNIVVLGQKVPGISVMISGDHQIVLCGRKATLKLVFDKLIKYINELED